MRTRIQIFVAALALATGQVALGAEFAVTDRLTRDVTLDVGGSILVESAFGSVEIVGTEAPGLSISAQKLVRGVDQAAIEEGRAQTELAIGGDKSFRVIRTVLPANRSGRWSSVINYQLRVPRTVHVKIGTHSSDRIRVANIGGNVFVKNVNGLVTLERVTGATTVESINGSIIFDTPEKPSANIALSTINGQVEVRVSPESNFRWAAETIKGEFRTTLPVRGRFDGSTFRGTVNSPDGPTLTTASMMGDIYVLSRGSIAKQAQSVRKVATPLPISASAVPARTIRQPLVQGSFTYATTIGNVAIGEVRGNARVETGAGEVQLGAVSGTCDVNSLGGPLHLGDIFGPINARTRAGDILIHAARSGGTVTTGGGTIRVLFNAAPIDLASDGGDIVVRQAGGPVNAETRSGDISIAVDPTLKATRLYGKTQKGSVNVTLPSAFRADVEITIITSDPDRHLVRSDFHGLAIRREQVGNKTKITATGKLNGGGERLTLYAEDGGVQLLSKAPTAVAATPR
jgi:DUF4097 and DUF4098 domain-containing protein YvlB